MVIKGPINKSSQKNKFVHSDDKHFARRKWRRSLKRIVYRFNQDVENWYDEDFFVSQLNGYMIMLSRC